MWSALSFFFYSPEFGELFIIFCFIFPHQHATSLELSPLFPTGTLNDSDSD